MISYKLIRSGRKTVALCIHNGGVEVRAPFHMPDHEIEKFIISKEKWIKSKLALSVQQTKQRVSFELNYGDMVTYCGKQYPIVGTNGSRVGFDDESFYMPPGLNPQQIKHACIQIYRMLAGRDLKNRVLEFTKRMAVMPAAVKINGAKARWGSCSAKRSLNFSWRLIMAESDVIDYVVVHELAHMTEMNHSPWFWDIVENILPDYRERRLKLKELQRRLCGEDWD
jgi:predicted metal-dependent hydrolase